MTKKHFILAAQLVNHIRQGLWTSDLPSWVDGPQATGLEIATSNYGNVSVHYIRAVWTAEAFCFMFVEGNVRFNRDRFLKACGLMS